VSTPTLNEIFGSKYYIRLDHQILTDHGIFYAQALYNDLILEVTLAPAAQVVRDSDPTKLKYKLTNIQLEYEMIRNKFLEEEALGVYHAGKEFACDHVMRHKIVPFKKDADSPPFSRQIRLHRAHLLHLRSQQEPLPFC